MRTETHIDTTLHEQDLTYQEREAEIEREDGEVLLMLDTEVEKSGAHVHQYKLASDGVVSYAQCPC
jgi:hypothetical protein